MSDANDSIIHEDVAHHDHIDSVVAEQAAKAKKPAFTVVDRRKLEDEAPVEHVPAVGPAPELPAAAAPVVEVEPELTEEDKAFEADVLAGRVSIADLYRRGLPHDAICEVAPNVLILAPIRRPGVSEGGIITETDARKGTLGTNCLAYFVLGRGAHAPVPGEHWMVVRPGDVVVVNNASLEPLHSNLEPLVCHVRYAKAKLRLTDIAPQPRSDLNA